MGNALISCIGGCVCNAHEVSGQLGFNASLSAFAHLKVSPHPKCEMQVGFRYLEECTADSPSIKYTKY